MSIITTATATATTITATKIRTLYRDFLHILRHSHPTTSTTNASTPPWQQQLRSEFRKPLLVNDHDDTASSSSSAATTITTSSSTNHNNNNAIEERMRYGTSRLAFLRMNAIHYRPREAPSLVMDTTTSAEGTISSSTSTSATIPSKQRFLYKNGQRYDISNPNRNNNMTSSTKRNDKGYIISPYDGKNLDPESVTRHRKNLRRAGFMNNAHAKGIF
jgi:hypothetical protein